MKKRLLLSAMIALVGAPLTQPVLNFNTDGIQHVQAQELQLVALGGSLDQNQAQQTLQLLGANAVDSSNIIYVDGTMINQYLQDGSGPGTVVYSSAYIQGMNEGYGVQVQIVTQQNITGVSATTYQNAAITAGARNAQIRIATVSPVTGEGALAGVYALLEQQGVALNPEDVQVAQNEISLVNEIIDSEGATISDSQVNQMISEIKQEIVNTNINAENSDVNVDNSEETNTNINNIVNNITNNYGVSDEELQLALEQFAQEFAKTEAAQSEDTIGQLEQSIQEDWTDVLAGLEGSVPAEELLAAERVDFSDTETYHPILQAFSDELYRVIEAGEVVDRVYSDTFIFEAMSPDLTSEEKSALNHLRTVMYQYAANQDEFIASGEYQPGFTSIKENWTNKLNAFEGLKASDPVQAEIISRLAIATGRAPQVYNYVNPTQEGTVISLENMWDNPAGNQADFTIYSFDVATDEMSELDVVTNEMVPLQAAYDFNAIYGVSVENLYQSQVEIPADYTLPGYVPEESEVEETSSEEETSEDEVSSEESLSEDVPSEEVPVEEEPGEDLSESEATETEEQSVEELTDPVE